MFGPVSIKNMQFKVTVKFKPKNVKSENASEHKKVSFILSDWTDKKEYYKIARNKAIEENIIDRYGMKYWEPFESSVSAVHKSENK